MDIFYIQLQTEMHTFSFEIRTNDYDAFDLAYQYLKYNFQINQLDLELVKYDKAGYDLDHISKGITDLKIHKYNSYIHPIIESVELLSPTEINEWM